MKTIIKKVNKEHPEADIICQAGDILKKGGLVAFPTETVMRTFFRQFLK